MDRRDNPESTEGKSNGERPGTDRLPGMEENPFLFGK
jgi:hypothetical protein